jgi:hypothetical protein
LISGAKMRGNESPDNGSSTNSESITTSVGPFWAAILKNPAFGPPIRESDAPQIRRAAVRGRVKWETEELGRLLKAGIESRSMKENTEVAVFLESQDLEIDQSTIKRWRDRIPEGSKFVRPVIGKLLGREPNELVPAEAIFRAGLLAGLKTAVTMLQRRQEAFQFAVDITESQFSLIQSLATTVRDFDWNNVSEWWKLFEVQREAILAHKERIQSAFQSCPFVQTILDVLGLVGLLLAVNAILLDEPQTKNSILPKPVKKYEGGMRQPESAPACGNAVMSTVGPSIFGIDIGANPHYIDQRGCLDQLHERLWESVIGRTIPSCVVVVHGM